MTKHSKQMHRATQCFRHLVQAACSCFNGTEYPRAPNEMIMLTRDVLATSA